MVAAVGSRLTILHFPLWPWIPAKYLSETIVLYHPLRQFQLLLLSPPGSKPPYFFIVPAFIGAFSSSPSLPPFFPSFYLPASISFWFQVGDLVFSFSVSIYLHGVHQGNDPSSRFRFNHTAL